jgi:putative hydrolase of HD superfamily
LAESQIGDFTPDQIDKEEKKKIENTAFEKITKYLPEEIKIKYLEIWADYQENISEESKIVHQIDKLEMALQAKKYQKEGYDKEKLRQFFDSAKEEITNSQLKELFTQIINEK